jgi:hypothetical protein
MTNYASTLEKFVIVRGTDTGIMNEYHSAKSLRFIGNGEALISEDEYNKIVEDAHAESMVDQYESDNYYGSYEPY